MKTTPGGIWAVGTIPRTPSKTAPTSTKNPAISTPGRWYDLRVEVSGKHVKCYCDGELIHDVNYDSDGVTKALYASATDDQKNGDLIVKVVNAGTDSLTTQIALPGAKNLTGKGSATVLTSG